MFYVGEKIKGKWNNNSYLLLEKLGQGGIGTVYKVKDMLGNIFALKISADINSITREFENMKKLKSIDVVPKVYEIDDYIKNGETFHFFTMNSIDGYNLKQIISIRNMKIKNILAVGVVVLENLKKIYKLGYVYSDIKLENIMIEKTSKKIYLVDFGGVVDKGTGIKEYTPTYNIASWGIDFSNNYNKSMIFSVNMLITSMILRKEFSPMTEKISDIIRKLNDSSVDRKIKSTLKDNLSGKTQDVDKYALNMRQFIYSKDTDFIETDYIDMFFKGSILIFLSVLILYIVKL